ncbi:MAG: RidA family protein [Neisseriaceae bacterium]
MPHQLINPDTVFNSRQYGFSQAVLASGSRQLFLSGQVAVDAQEQTVAGDMKAQTLACLANIERVLQAAQAHKEQVTMLRIYIKESASSAEEQQHITEALQAYFGDHAPASSWIVVAGLSLPEWLIEIEAQAVIPA